MLDGQRLHLVDRSSICGCHRHLVEHRVAVLADQRVLPRGDVHPVCNFLKLSPTLVCGLLDKAYVQALKSSGQSFAARDRARAPVQHSTCTAVGEPIRHVKVRHDHHPHQMRRGQRIPANIFAVPIACQMEGPRRLYSGSLANRLHFLLAVPLSPGALRAAPAQYLERVVVRPCQAAHHDAVPAVPVAALCEDRGAPFELNARSVDCGTRLVRLGDKSACPGRDHALRNVRQHSVEILKLGGALGVVNHAAILGQLLKIER